MQQGFRRSLKVTVVGDGAVGKTCLLMCLTTGESPRDHVPTVFDSISHPMKVDEELLNLQLWDTAGQDEYKNLRTLSYPKTNIFLICFGIDSRTSMEHVEDVWVPELRHYCPNIPYILVGTKRDLRSSIADAITSRETEELAKKIDAVGIYECTATHYASVERVFQQAVRLEKGANKKSSRLRICPLL